MVLLEFPPHLVALPVAVKPSEQRFICCLSTGQTPLAQLMLLLMSVFCASVSKGSGRIYHPSLIQYLIPSHSISTALKTNILP